MVLNKSEALSCLRMMPGGGPETPRGVRRRSPSVMETPSQRGREGSAEHGSVLSPKAKRPAIMINPDMVPMSDDTMTMAQLTNAVKNLDARAEARNAWVTSIAEAVTDHADLLEACSRESIAARARLIEFQKTVQDGQTSAENQVRQLFLKSDEMMKQYEALFDKTNKNLIDLEAADAAIKATMENKIANIEKVIQRSAETPAQGPPGIGQQHELLINVQERVMLMEQAVLKVQAAAEEQHQQTRTMSARIASMEASAGDGWAAAAEARRQQDAGTQGSANTSSGPKGAPGYTSGSGFGGGATGPSAGGATSGNVPMPMSDPGAARRFLDDKVAQSQAFQYDEAKAPKWILKVRNYVVGVYPELMQLLKWAEDQQHREIRSQEIPSLRSSLMLDMDPVLLSQRLWSWIQLCLKDDDNSTIASTTLRL